MEKDRIEELMFNAFADIAEQYPTAKVYYTPNSNYLEFESPSGKNAKLHAEYTETNRIRCILRVEGRTVEQDETNMRILTDAIIKMK